MEPNASDAASEPRVALPTEQPGDAESEKAEEADVVLVERALSGERAAFDLLVRRYQRQAVAVSYRLLGSSHDALEVTQDAFLKAFTSLPTLQTPAAFGGWLMRIVSNLSLNFRRGRKTRWQLPLDEVLGPIEGGSTKISAMGESASHGDDPLRRLESQELGQKLKEALAKLPEKQRLALIMFTIEEMPQKQVAEALQCSVEAVKWHVFQGRKKLRDLLGDVLQPAAPTPAGTAMNEELEFLISQYADGTLGEEAARALEARLAEDAEARAALAAHRKLTGMLRDMPMPGVQWDRLAARIDSAITDAAEAPAPYRMFTRRFAWGAMGLAASVLIAAGVSIRMFGGSRAGTVPGRVDVAVTRLLHVTGPRAEVATGPAMSDVSIGPGKGLANQSAPNIYGDLVSRPSSVLVASGAPATDDTAQLPF